MIGRRFKNTSKGVTVELGAEEREALALVLDQFRELLMIDSDPNLARLKPTARPDDPEANEQFREMVGDQLLRHRLEAIELVESGLEGATLDEEGVGAWMHTLNGVRLFLGDRLHIDEDFNAVGEDHPDAPALMLYEWLGWLLDQLVRAASKDLPRDNS